MKKITTYLLIGLIIGVVGGLIFYFARQRGPAAPNRNEIVVSPTLEASPSPEASPTPELTPTQGEVSPTPIQAGWQILNSSEHEFSIQHPPEMEVGETGRSGVELLLTGPTQEPNTELFDGIRLTFTQGDYQQEQFLSFTEEQRQEQLQQPSTEKASEIQEASLAGRQGYEFISTGVFGDTRYIYLPAGENEYLVILEAVFDPANQGFERIVEIMYDSLEIR